MEKRKCPSYFGDYKCHVKTNVKDSKGDFVYVDKCLKEAVENLSAVGLKTVASCCGHGIINPKITIEGLSDGKPDDLKSGDCNLAVVNGCAFLEDIKSARNDALSRKIEMKNMGLSAKAEQGQLDALNWVIEKIEYCR